MKLICVLGMGLMGLTGVLATGCTESTAQIQVCEPVGACDCSEGIERETRCTCVGGSTCEIDADNIEFFCEGNAACGMSCGDDCLVTCPGTTTCTVEVGTEGVVTCPGTATCDISCRSSCTVNISGTARATIHCLDQTAACEISGCITTDCGGGVHVCRTACPE